MERQESPLCARGGDAVADSTRPEEFWPGSFSLRVFLPCGPGRGGRAGDSTLSTAQVLPRRARGGLAGVSRRGEGPCGSVIGRPGTGEGRPGSGRHCKDALNL